MRNTPASAWRPADSPARGLCAQRQSPLLCADLEIKLQQKQDRSKMSPHPSDLLPSRTTACLTTSPRETHGRCE